MVILKWNLVVKLHRVIKWPYYFAKLIFSACLWYSKWLTRKKIIILHLCALQDWEQEDTPWDTTPIIHRHLVRNKMGSLPSIFLVKIIFHLLTLTFSHDFLKQRTLVVDRRHLTRNIYFAEQFSCQNLNKIIGSISNCFWLCIPLCFLNMSNSCENVMNSHLLI